MRHRPPHNDSPNPQPQQPIKLNPLWRQKLRERTEAEAQWRTKEKLVEEEKKKERDERRIAAELEALKSGQEVKPLDDFPDLPDSLFHTPYQNNHDKLRNAFNRVLNEGVDGSGSPVTFFKGQKRVFWEAVRQHNEWGRFLFGIDFMEYQKRDFIPMKWMLKDEIIKRRLKDPNDVEFNRLKTLLNYIWATRLDQHACIELAGKIGAGKIPKIEKRSKRDEQGQPLKNDEKEEVRVERDYAFISPLDFTEIQKRFGKGYSEGYVKQYMDEFSRIGILKRFKNRTGPHSQTVYAIGYWNPIPPGKGKFKAQPFLQNTEKFRAALRGFGLRKREEKR